MVSISSFHFYGTAQKSHAGDVVVPRLSVGEDVIKSSVLSVVHVGFCSLGSIPKLQQATDLYGLRNG